jgi:hypothetical protein
MMEQNTNDYNNVKKFTDEYNNTFQKTPPEPEDTIKLLLNITEEYVSIVEANVVLKFNDPLNKSNITFFYIDPSTNTVSKIMDTPDGFDINSNIEKNQKIRLGENNKYIIKQFCKTK